MATALPAPPAPAGTATIDRLRDARRMTLAAGTPLEGRQARQALRESLMAHAIATKESTL